MSESALPALERELDEVVVEGVLSRAVLYLRFPRNRRGISYKE